MSDRCQEACKLIRDAASSLRFYQRNPKTPESRMAVTRHAALLVLAIDELQQAGEQRLARIAGMLIRRIGRFAHS